MEHFTRQIARKSGNLERDLIQHDQIVLWTLARRVKSTLDGEEPASGNMTSALGFIDRGQLFVARQGVT